MAETVINFQKFLPIGGLGNDNANPQQVASVAGTQPAPLAYATIITGTEAIVTLTVPYTGFQGTILLIPLAAFTWTNAGNIAVAGTAVAYRALAMTYIQSTGKWYPSYV